MYAAGVHQCVCTEVRQGGDGLQPLMYPVAYNWTDAMFYIGRERIGIEYIDEVMELDHWAFGPHHAWSRPDDGALIRMWQPFNGLQVVDMAARPSPQERERRDGRFTTKT